MHREGTTDLAVLFVFLFAVIPVSKQVWPLEVEGPKSLTVKEGEKVTFQCRVLNDPDATISWMKGSGSHGNGSIRHFVDKKIMEISGRNQKSLVLHKVTAEHSGQYMCLAGNGNGTMYNDAWLTVVPSGNSISDDRAPRWKTVRKPREQSVYEGGSLTLVCDARGRPKPKIYWFKNGLDIMSSSSLIKIKKHSLTFKHLRVSDRGNYMCLVANEHGQLEFTFTVDVHVYVWPLEVEGPKNVTALDGDKVTFRCRVLNDPKATISWIRGSGSDDTSSIRSYLDETPEFLKRSGLNQEELILPDVTTRSSGQYICVAANRIGAVFKDGWLTVLPLEHTTKMEEPFSLEVMAGVVVGGSAILFIVCLVLVRKYCENSNINNLHMDAANLPLTYPCQDNCNMQATLDDTNMTFTQDRNTFGASSGMASGTPAELSVSGTPAEVSVSGTPAEISDNDYAEPPPSYRQCTAPPPPYNTLFLTFDCDKTIVV